MKDYLLDLNKYVCSTGYFDKIKITGNNSETKIESIEKDRKIVLKGKFKNAASEFVGEFGLSNLNMLGAIVNDSEFGSDESTLGVNHKQYNGKDIPDEIRYKNKTGSLVCYRLMNPEYVPDQPKYIEPTWDIVVEPTKSAVKEFSYWASALSGYEQYFTPKIENKTLKFWIGEENAASQRAALAFAENIKGNFDYGYAWPVSHVVSLLKLSETTKCELKFSSKGALQIDMDTGVSELKFILPRKSST